MKKRSGRNLIRFFYHLLVVLVMAMPMLSGLVRVIYVQSNKNAKDSYYGEIINQERLVNNDLSTYSPNENYLFTTSMINAVSDFTYTRALNYIYCKLLSPLGNDLVVGNNYYIGIYKLPNMNNVLYGFSDIRDGTVIYLANSESAISFDIEIFTIVSNAPTDLFYNTDILKRYVYVDYSYLDNAFDYSIWKTMQDFTFHSDFRFTDIANGMLMTFDNNNLYIQYINFYINWVLTCAVISFAPYVLLTFYHLAIGLLDKFMKKGDDL